MYGPQVIKDYLAPTRGSHPGTPCKESIENAVLLDDSLFKGRQLKVMPKRVNLPNFKGGGKGRKGKGGRFRGGGRRGGRRGRSFNYYY